MIRLKSLVGLLECSTYDLLHLSGVQVDAGAEARHVEDCMRGLNVLISVLVVASVLGQKVSIILDPSTVYR